jgi:DNA-binding winged helix-turn-helix (wHTH) protein/tetratricopeptide (TPR) repeat protein
LVHRAATPGEKSVQDTQLQPQRVGGETLCIGGWRVDPRADEIRRDGRVVKLEPLKMRLLLALAQRPGEVVLTQELLDDVWAGLVVTSSSVYQGIAQLRRVLGEDDGSPWIETIPRKGYRLVAPVQWISARADQPAVAPALAEPPVATRASAGPLPAPASSLPPADAVASPESPRRRRGLLAAVTVIAAGATGAATWRFIASRPPPLPVRIAVLPFADRTPGATERALAQGLAFDVIRALGRHTEVDVLAAESALALAGGTAPPAEAAARIGAAFLMQGELNRAGERVQVAVRLLALPDSQLRWQQQFERTIGSAAELPQQIAGGTAAALHLPTPARVAASGGPTEAYELYVLGEHAWRPKTQEAFAKARDYFTRGISLDPSYARNYIGLGWTWIGEATNGAGIDMPQAFARAAPLFDKALRLDPDSAEALTAQGVLQTFAGRHQDARQHFERALMLDPGYAQAHHSWGVAEYDDGWPARAAAHFQRAAELNPLSPSPMDRLGAAQVAAGNLAQAEQAYRRAIELQPRHPNGHWGLGIAAFAKGDLAAAVSNYRRALELENRRPFLWDELGWLYLDLGLPSLAAQAFGRTVAQLPASRWPAVHAAYAWALQPDQGTPPDILSLSPRSAPEDGVAIEVMLLRAMAGMPLDDALLQRALDAQRGLDESLKPMLWFVFLGRHPLLDLATVYVAMGQPERALPHLAEAEQDIDRLERQGNVFHALHLHRARLHALRGENEAALTAVERAIAAGSRRGWLLQRDPAFSALRALPRFTAALDRLRVEVDRHRAALGART